ncbi:MAG: glycosyl transferase family 2, partial [Pseudomonadota bacterium]|nr:glycosyl transferase family 2 [Pseudomonadota bacterium]
YQCPINHLLDFVHNAQRFHSKWGFYPCVNVLNAYADQGFINADFKQNGIKIKHLPQQVEEDKADVPVEQLTVTNAQNNVEFTSFHSPEKGSDLLSTTA